MIPAIFGLAIYELNMLVDTLLASLLPEGSISYLYYGNRLVQLPLGVFGVALGIAILPMLSHQAANKDFSEMVKNNRLWNSVNFIYYNPRNHWPYPSAVSDREYLMGKGRI